MCRNLWAATIGKNNIQPGSRTRLLGQSRTQHFAQSGQ
jgi:hypothetical protein